MRTRDLSKCENVQKWTRYFQLFFSDACERRVELSVESKILTSTFWKFAPVSVKLTTKCTLFPCLGVANLYECSTDTRIVFLRLIINFCNELCFKRVKGLNVASKYAIQRVFDENFPTLPVIRPPFFDEPQNVTEIVKKAMPSNIIVQPVRDSYMKRNQDFVPKILITQVISP